MQFSTLVTLKMMSETEKQQQYALLHFNNKQKKMQTAYNTFKLPCYLYVLAIFTGKSISWLPSVFFLHLIWKMKTFGFWFFKGSIPSCHSTKSVKH